LFTLIQAAGWPIYFLLACCFAGVYVITRLFLRLRWADIGSLALLEEAIAVSAKQLPKREIAEQLAVHSRLGALLASGWLALIDQPQLSSQELLDHMTQTGKRLAHDLNRYLGALSALVSLAPLLGLFGTVIGMIDIFGAQASHTASGLAGQANPAELAHGISVALYNTAFGLIIAVVALLFWRYFRARVDSQILFLEEAGHRFSLHLRRQFLQSN
jgi:biopolymer transport protein ExbB